MAIALITGSAGLIGSEAAIHFANRGLHVVGIDNDMRREFFGDEASTRWNRRRVEQSLGASYTHFASDIRDGDAIDRIFARFGREIELVIHAAAQPSHEWAARNPTVDFEVNATGTLHLLEATRKNCPEAVFVHLSTNKVYGDRANSLPLIERETRWEIDPSHRYADGVDESMSIDACLHSLFGASKAAADLLVQEYGRYYGLRTTVFRAGCLTGPSHAGTELHGFLAYLMKCAMTGRPYTVYGYKGKQVRDNIHSADLVAAVEAVYAEPGVAEVFNIGGGRFSNCSMLEAINACESICGRELPWTYDPTARLGDHVWWISDNGKFKALYPGWCQRYGIDEILQQIHDENFERWNPSLEREQ